MIFPQHQQQQQQHRLGCCLLLVVSCIWTGTQQLVTSFAPRQLQRTATTTAFVRPTPASTWSTTTCFDISSSSSSSSSSFAWALNAKKKASVAALEALEALELAEDAPLSKKELMEQAKKASGKKKGNNESGDTVVAAVAETSPKSKKDLKAAALAALDQLDVEQDEATNNNKKLSKKELRAQAAGMDKTTSNHVQVNGKDDKASDDHATNNNNNNKSNRPMSKKEAALLRALELEEEKSMAAEAHVDQDSTQELNGSIEKGSNNDLTMKEFNLNVNGNEDDEDESSTTSNPNGITLEDKIRKERPPPRIRVMETSQPGYTSLRLENVGIVFRDQQVLKDVTWGVQTGDRIGLVGANGAGKTTQLRILSGEMEPTTGDVIKSSKELRVAMLRQEFIDELDPQRTLRDEFYTVFAEENNILQNLRACEVELENMGAHDGDPQIMQDILDRMQELQAKADSKSVYALESRVQKVMNLMGFTDEEADDLVASFSGGWKMRIGLGKVLLQDPNILLLDEPTNHLDLESVEWLEEFLRQQKIPMVIVSHDREFLDQVCTKIVDAEGGICNEYDGNYSRFLQLKKSRMDAWHAAFNAQEKKIKEERAWMNQFKIKQPQAVQQRQAKLEKFLKSDEYVKKPPFVGKPLKFRFPDAPRLSPEVAEVKHLSHSYSNGAFVNRLFEDAELSIDKGDRIAVVGPNGSGKSTLLRLLIGREQPEEGSAQIVGANVVMNYFEQNQADALDLDKTVVETIQAASNGQSYNELRALLGQFLFKGDSVEKKVANLSGGEKARLSLCCMMLKPANLLILDEPTNHLDIPAKEMLEEALQHFSGSVMIVSHDRYFISKVATTIVAIEEKKLVKYGGDYKFYMESRSDIKEKVEARYVAGVNGIESAPIINVEELQRPKSNFGGAKTANLVSRKDKGVKNAKRLQLK